MWRRFGGAAYATLTLTVFTIQAAALVVLTWAFIFDRLGVGPEGIVMYEVVAALDAVARLHVAELVADVLPHSPPPTTTSAAFVELSGYIYIAVAASLGLLNVRRALPAAQAAGPVLDRRRTPRHRNHQRFLTYTLQLWRGGRTRTCVGITIPTCASR